MSVPGLLDHVVVGAKVSLVQTLLDKYRWAGLGITLSGEQPMYYTYSMHETYVFKLLYIMWSMNQTYNQKSGATGRFVKKNVQWTQTKSREA